MWVTNPSRFQEAFISTIQQKELALLLHLFEAHATTLLQTAVDAHGDFAEVEEAIGAFILRVRPALVESGLRVCSASCSRDYACPDCVSALYRWDSRQRMATTSEGEGRYGSVRYRCNCCGKSYERLKRQGLPIGSGAMESGIKQLSTKRLRQLGMKWSKRGAHDMLSLRAAHLSGELTNTVRRKNNALHAAAARFTRPILQLAA